MTTIIDGKNHILGRLSSFISKKILNGEKVVVLNSDYVLITGNKSFSFQNYKNKLNRGKIRKGPYHYKKSDAILKRTIRGMIPFYTTSGRNAFKLVHTFAGIPSNYSNSEKISLGKANILNTSNYISLKDLSTLLGVKKR